MYSRISDRRLCLGFFILLVWVCLLGCDAHASASDASSSCDATTTTTSPPRLPLSTNVALIFIKPHANTAATQDLVRQRLLQQPGLQILSERQIDAETMQAKQLVDQHYYSIASKATLVPAAEISVPADAFSQAFGESWHDVVQQGRAYNCQQACQQFGYTPDTLQQAWENGNKVVKLGGGFYCAQIPLPLPSGQQQEDEDASSLSSDTFYLLNGFFLAMRQQYVRPGASIYCFEIAWPAHTLSWADFRAHVLGRTDPAVATPTSLRGLMYRHYQRLGLPAIPNQGENGVHGSASPWEGLVERANWLQQQQQQRDDLLVGNFHHHYRDDDLSQALLEAGLSPPLLQAWSKDPRIVVNGDTQEMASLFDALEDLDAQACLEENGSFVQIAIGYKDTFCPKEKYRKHNARDCIF